MLKFSVTFTDEDGMPDFVKVHIPQKIKDTTWDLVLDDDTMADIFATAKEEDYLEEVLRLCVRRGIALDRIERDCKRVNG